MVEHGRAWCWWWSMVMKSNNVAAADREILRPRGFRTWLRTHRLMTSDALRWKAPSCFFSRSFRPVHPQSPCPSKGKVALVRARDLYLAADAQVNDFCLLALEGALYARFGGNSGLAQTSTHRLALLAGRRPQLQQTSYSTSIINFVRSSSVYPGLLQAQRPTS